MADSVDPRLHCHFCGHLISGPVRTYRCPACGSYDVALIPLPETPQENMADRAGRSTLITRIAPIRYFFPSPPQGMPPALWGHLRPLRMLCACTLILLGIAVAAVVLRMTVAAYAFLIAGLTINCFLAPMTPLLAKRRLRRLAQEIIADNFERCLECGYPLKGLPDKHRCPECGEPYDIATVKKTWERYFEAQRTKK